MLITRLSKIRQTNYGFLKFVFVKFSTAFFLLFFVFLFFQITPVFAGNVKVIITSVSPSTISSTSVVIHWTTNVDSSSKVDYGLSNSYGASTVETDTSPLVIDHSVTLSGFISCSTYHYRVRSKNATNDERVDSDNTFTTSGCVADAQATATASAQITTTSGGSLTLEDSNSHGLTSTVPTSFAESDANFQAHQLDTATVLATTSTPSTYSLVGNYIYQLEALSDNSTTISTLTNPLTIAMSYGASDVSGLDESTLKIYRYDGSNWTVLTGCVVDTVGKTVTCQTSNFSVFGLFGQTPTPTNSNSNTSSSNNSSSSSSSSSCGNQAPTSTPDLFQINTTWTKATLYFAPAGKPYSDYYISYGNGAKDEEYSASFSLSNTTGAIYYTVNELSPNTIYSFKVRAGNGCASGEWSKTMKISTTSGKVVKKYYSSLISSVSGNVNNLVGKLPIIQQQTTVTPVLKPSNNTTVSPTQQTKQAPVPTSTPKKKTCFFFICW